MKIKMHTSKEVNIPEMEIIIISQNTQLVEKTEKAVKKEIYREIRNTGKKVSYKIISTQQN